MTHRERSLLLILYVSVCLRGRGAVEQPAISRGEKMIRMKGNEENGRNS